MNIDKLAKLGYWILFFIVILLLVSVVSIWVIPVIAIIKIGANNIKKIDDPVFAKIDQYKDSWERDDEYYIRQIQVINFYYGEGGKVKEIVDKNEIGRLYKRLDFLEMQGKLFDNLIACFYSFSISIIATLALQMLDYEGIVTKLVFAGIIFFFAVISLRYAERGHAGSYRHYIGKYETKLLRKK